MREPNLRSKAHDNHYATGVVNDTTHYQTKCFVIQKDKYSKLHYFDIQSLFLRVLSTILPLQHCTSLHSYAEEQVVNKLHFFFNSKTGIKQADEKKWEKVNVAWPRRLFTIGSKIRLGQLYATLVERPWKACRLGDSLSFFFFYKGFFVTL